VCLGWAVCAFFWFSLDDFVLVLFAFVALELVSAVMRQEIIWEERLRNKVFRAEWDVKSELNRSLVGCQVAIFLTSDRDCERTFKCDYNGISMLDVTADNTALVGRAVDRLLTGAESPGELDESQRRTTLI